jgi:hypothetical protein
MLQVRGGKEEKSVKGKRKEEKDGGNNDDVPKKVPTRVNLRRHKSLLTTYLQRLLLTKPTLPRLLKSVVSHLDDVSTDDVPGLLKGVELEDGVVGGAGFGENRGEGVEVAHSGGDVDALESVCIGCNEGATGLECEDGAAKEKVRRESQYERREIGGRREKKRDCFKRRPQG